MKPFTALLITFLFVINADSQMYGFKKDWTAAPDISKATYVMYLTKYDDTTYLCKYYNKYGVAVNYETYKDSALTIPNGLFIWYNKKGIVDSLGYVYNKLKDKLWYYRFSSEFQPQLVEEYDKGHLVIRKDSSDLKKIYHSSAMKYNSNQNLNEPEFPGGLVKWKQFLEKNLMPPQPIWGTRSNLNTGDVVLDILFDSSGKITMVFPLQSLDIQSDQEAIRAIKLSPDWLPAKLNGMPVGYHHIQSIHFGSNI